MISYITLEEQVDADFTRARRKAFLRRLKARLTNDLPSSSMLSFEEVRKRLGARVGARLGRRVVRVEQIVGSVGRSLESRWKRIDRAHHRGDELPPVELYKLGDSYFVMDGNHRVSVARYHGVEMIEAEVTEFGARLPIVRAQASAA